MNDVTDLDRARPVQEDELPVWENMSASMLAQQKALFIRINRTALFGILVQFIVILALGGLIIAMIPLQKLVPLILHVNADGTYEMLRDIRELPQNKQEDVIGAVLWRFVESREGYYWEGAPRRYAVASALSTGKAQIEYQTWFTKDTTSPQYRYKDRGYVEVEQVPNSVFILDKIDTCRETNFCQATLSYWRSEKQYGQAATPRKRYTATLSFIVVENLVPGERTTINPAGIKVIAYHSDCEDCGT